MEAAKTLNEMSARERLDLIETVADALEYRAEEARETGYQTAAANSSNLATAIRALASQRTESDLASAELLLQLGINYCVATERRPRKHSFH